MRDVNRIPMLMWKLQEYWMRNPDLRLGQMMIIAEKRLELDDIWNVEDEELINAIMGSEDEESKGSHDELLQKIHDIMNR